MRKTTTAPLNPWTHDPAFTPLEFASFVYRITLPDGRYYWGKKALWVMKAGKIVRESDWQTYWGSSKEVRALIKQHGPANCQREILHFCVSRGHASWMEAVTLIKQDCMLDPRCLNGNVLERFNRKVIQGYSDDTRREKYLQDIAEQKAAAGLK